ncbi:SDR family oxidoreductase [Streptomyces sp. Ag109_O5-10]|uniref:SDR family NAD(P)-dependent oxidoreductase n=1 Tax=Streptomyces sp. Ag109_O5-10 TaxID=1855349 RepID=UPI00089BBF26|nr:SDR family NAD(P)-dependent oxidoreductase [Streptomyces sp. Ag109_O5-10]SED58961.1 short chain dehydrogenase [Streptomyces sp. Ag109_O5-10]SEF17759.1 short chain dehydrogenase [Streptomyces sp. Ag109_O5-10]
MTLGTAVIVGVGPGIGLELTRAFANAGHPVAMLARNKTKMDTYAAELASTGQDVRGYATDVADAGNLRSAIHSAITDLGAPDVLIYSVAVLDSDSPLGGDDQKWVANMAIDVLGARVAADAVLPELRDGRGTLLFAGGGYALHPSKKYSSLSVGKAALRAYVQLLHEELAGTGVHATSITITKTIGSEPRFEPATLAQAYLALTKQPESEWQHELVY